MKDLLKSVRVRLPRRLGLGSRLNPSAVGAASTADAYFGVEATHELSGEFRGAHFFI
jgi:hypothetical protein